MQPPTFSFDKFSNATLFVLNECESLPGLTVLIKLLFRADFAHYRKYLRSITGAEYIALERGPVPDEYRLLFTKLQVRGHVVQETVDVGAPRAMEILRPLRKPELAAFEESELEVLRSVVSSDGCKTGKQLSDETHAEIPWRAVWCDGDGEAETIPYALARWEDNRCSPEDVKAATERLSEPAIRAALAGLSR